MAGSDRTKFARHWPQLEPAEYFRTWWAKANSGIGAAASLVPGFPWDMEFDYLKIGNKDLTAKLCEQ